MPVVLNHTLTGEIPQRKSPLDRVLSIFTDVRAGEGVSALLLALNIFALLASYYVLKTVREALILSESGAEVKSYAAAGQALLLAGLIPLYGAIASRVDRVRLISGVTLFFASHLLIFYALGSAGVRVGVAFFLWIGIFNLMVPAQFWAFANDVYTNDRGKRLFPLIGLGSLLGALVGGQVASSLFASVGPYQLMLYTAFGLALCILPTLLVHRREQHDPSGAQNAEAPVTGKGGFQLVFTDRYLLLIAVMVMTLNIINTVGEFIMGKLVVDYAAQQIASGAAAGASEAAIIGQFYGNFYFWVNLVGLLVQLFVVSRVFKYAGVRGALYVMPIVALFSYSMLAVLPVLAIVRIAKIVENGCDYSIQNTTRHALFLPTSREAKYKAKQVVDSFFWRAGDLLQAVVVLAGAALAFGIREFAAVNLVLVVAWLGLVVAIAREHRRRTAAESAEQAA